MNAFTQTGNVESCNISINHCIVIRSVNCKQYSSCSALSNIYGHKLDTANSSISNSGIKFRFLLINCKVSSIDTGEIIIIFQISHSHMIITCNQLGCGNSEIDLAVNNILSLRIARHIKGNLTCQGTGNIHINDSILTKSDIGRTYIQAGRSLAGNSEVGLILSGIKFKVA